jgi:hypothetical protein
VTDWKRWLKKDEKNVHDEDSTDYRTRIILRRLAGVREEKAKLKEIVRLVDPNNPLLEEEDE